MSNIWNTNGRHVRAIYLRHKWPTWPNHSNNVSVREDWNILNQIIEKEKRVLVWIRFESL